MIRYSDEQIVQGIKERSDAVFDFLIKEFKKIVILKIMEWGGTSTDGEDIFNDGIAGLIEMVSKRNFKLTCKISTLLLQICKHQWGHVLEKNQAKKNYKKRHNEDFVTEDRSEEMDEVLKRRIVDECFAKLESECQHIMNAYFKEVPPRDIADIFGISYANLRLRKSRCYLALRQIVDCHPDYKFLIESGEISPDHKSRPNE